MDARIPEIVREANARGLLAVHEVYRTLQGETTYAGLRCVLVRLTGCPLRCAWCDTTHAYEGGALRSVEDVAAQVLADPIPLVGVTGGEPLLQPAVHALLARLADAGRTVLLETSGALDARDVDPRVVRVVDVKPPSSGETAHSHAATLDDLRPHDQVKFVLAAREDYEFARETVRVRGLPERCHVLFSTALGHLAPAEVAAWILADGLDVRLQVQLHKVIWEPTRRGV